MCAAKINYRCVPTLYTACNKLSSGGGDALRYEAKNASKENGTTQHTTVNLYYLLIVI